jgi:hypothetical protein
MQTWKLEVHKITKIWRQYMKAATINCRRKWLVKIKVLVVELWILKPCSSAKVKDLRVRHQQPKKKSKTKVQSSSLFSCGSLTFHRIWYSLELTNLVIRLSERKIDRWMIWWQNFRGTYLKRRIFCRGTKEVGRRERQNGPHVLVDDGT